MKCFIDSFIDSVSASLTSYVSGSILNVSAFSPDADGRDIRLLEGLVY